jgi:hypothetical protein
MSNRTIRQKFNLRKLGILVGIIVAVAVAGSLLLFPKLFENYSGALSFISLLVAIALFFYQQDRERKEKDEELEGVIRRFCNTFGNDIKQIREAITGEKYEKVTSKNGKASTTVYLSTKIYDSLIYSGYTTQFETDTQTNLDNLYYKIERNNDNIRRRTDAIISRDSKLISDTAGIEQVIENFHDLISDYQTEILDLLDKVEKNLSHELEKVSKNLKE